MVASDLSRGASEFAEPNEPQEETVSALMARLDWRSAACWVSPTSILKPISEDVRNALDKGEMPKILCDSEAEFEQGASTHLRQMISAATGSRNTDTMADDIFTSRHARDKQMTALDLTPEQRFWAAAFASILDGEDKRSRTSSRSGFRYTSFTRETGRAIDGEK